MHDPCIQEPAQSRSVFCPVVIVDAFRLLRLQANHRALAARVGTAVLAADLDYRICYVTPAVTGLLGLNGTEVVGQDLRETMKQSGWPDADAVLCEAALTDGAQTFDAMIGASKIALRVFLMRDARERPCGFLVLAQRSVSK